MGQKIMMCTLFLGGGRGAYKVYGLFTHENVDIYGWPPNTFGNKLHGQGSYHIKVTSIFRRPLPIGIYIS